MNSLPYPDDILDSFCTGDYLTEKGELLVAQRKKFDEAFTFVDGVKYPLSLVHPEIPQEGDQLGMIGVETVKDPDPMSVEEYMRRKIRNNLDGNYTSSRGLWDIRKGLCIDDGVGMRAYVSVVGLDSSGFRELMARLSADFGNRALAVLDAGCGQGFGFKQLLELDEIDGDNSVGLTLPIRQSWASPDPDLLYANIMHCGRKREFDLTLSAYGALTYHPTNLYEQRYIEMLALLQAVNLTKPGGIILENSLKWPSIERLINDGVLRFNNLSENMALRVLRHPTVNEVMDYMRPKAA